MIHTRRGVGSVLFICKCAQQDRSRLHAASSSSGQRDPSVSIALRYLGKDQASRCHHDGDLPRDWHRPGPPKCQSRRFSFGHSVLHYIDLRQGRSRRLIGFEQTLAYTIPPTLGPKKSTWVCVDSFPPTSIVQYWES